MSKTIQAGVVYFVIVLGTGFLLGVVRVPFLVPRIGERWAELAEMPIMATVIYIAAGFILRRFPEMGSPSKSLMSGILALALSVSAELALATVLQDRTLAEFIASRDKISGSVYIVLLMVFAVMPRLRLSRQSHMQADVSRPNHSLKRSANGRPPSTLRHQHVDSASLRMGIIAGYAVAALSVAYAFVLSAGLLTLPSSDAPIQNPWFTAMEVLILAIAPAMVAFTVVLHAWAPPARKSLAVLSIIAMSMCAVVTCSVHFTVLTLSRHSAFVATDWATQVLSFNWPSVVYTLDILAWDFFFPIGALCAAPIVQGAGLARFARVLLFSSAALAFAGMAGVPLANMNVRNIGIIGYVVLFPIATVLLAIVWQRARAQRAA